MCIILLSMFILRAHADNFVDDEYRYRIDIPEGSVVDHFPHQHSNLRFALPDSSAVFYIFALDVNEIPRGEYASDDTHSVFKKSYIEKLDREVFNVGENIIEDKENSWIKRNERRYDLGNGRQVITHTYYDEEYPHIVAVFGCELDRPIIKATLDSFRTSAIELTGKGIIVYIVSLFVILIVSVIALKFVDNTMVSVVFFILLIAVIFLIVSCGVINMPGHIWQWI